MVTNVQFRQVCFYHSLFASSFFEYVYSVCMYVHTCMNVSTSVSNFFTFCFSDNGFLFCFAVFVQVATLKPALHSHTQTDTYPAHAYIRTCVYVHICTYVHTLLVACVKRTKPNRGQRVKEDKATTGLVHRQQAEPQ